MTGHAPSSPVTRSAMSAMKTIAETGTEVSAGNKRLEETQQDVGGDTEAQYR